MTRLEELTPGTSIRGITPDGIVTIENVKWFGSDAIQINFLDSRGKLETQILYRDNEPILEKVSKGRPWSFDGNPAIFNMVAEAHRISLAHLFDPLLAIHTSNVNPLPHQITAVYERMLERQPLRFLLADDPGAGKTIMAGLLIRELIARGDIRKCLIVSPGSLVEQWQDELSEKFNLHFEILTNDKVESTRSGNWFLENPLAIARLDKLARDEEIQEKLIQVDWDLVICDEAHKMSASVFGSEVKYTRRYRLGELLSKHARNFLMLTATPHNGKEVDYQLFLALLDGDRFEGKFRDGVHTSDPSDLMRRLVKEKLLKFDGTPLFPERRAYTVNYPLSDAESILYHDVTEYVRNEFNRADALENDGRKGTVGFALTILQRRLASSPEAIYHSLRRRRERLEKRIREERQLKRGSDNKLRLDPLIISHMADDEDRDTDVFDDSTGSEYEDTQEKVVDLATAAQTIDELQAEITILADLEKGAFKVKASGADRKWDELSKLLQENSDMFDPNGIRRKLVIFTEHRDTLNYLHEKITSLLGKPEAVACIHGGMGREERRKMQESFKGDPSVQVLLATDAAGEGINLQRAHLMVNYDLPWNPNRLEQRFGRIHRIGQQEVCHLWNLVSKDTREGEVYHTLLEKLNQAKDALGGQVFDILGQVTFDDKSLRQLLVEAIRYGEKPEVRAHLFQKVEGGLDHNHLEKLLSERAISQDTLDHGKVMEIRQEMERAQARRLQPHFVQGFFLNAFAHLGGDLFQRETDRFEITHVPAVIRNRDRQIGRGDPLLHRYERITLHKDKIHVYGKPPAIFICPGHPLLDSTVDVLIEQNSDLLKQGTILVDDADLSEQPRVLVFLRHAINDGTLTSSGQRHVISERFQFVELWEDGRILDAGAAPYLDYRAPNVEEIPLLNPFRDAPWIQNDLERLALEYAAVHMGHKHLKEVRDRRERFIEKTIREVKSRLTREINHWDDRSNKLKIQEEAGKWRGGISSATARHRADELSARLQDRLKKLEQERKISASAPVVLGGCLILPKGLVSRLKGNPLPPAFARDTEHSELLAMNAVLDVEKKLGFIPRDVSKENRGYDIESVDPSNGSLRFIEVKGRVTGADTVTVSRNEILCARNSVEHFILALGCIDGEAVELRYLRNPFSEDPDLKSASVNYHWQKLWDLSQEPH